MPGLASALDRHLDEPDLRLLRGVSKSCRVHHVPAYLVGGTVRDLLLGHRPADLDISFSASSEFFEVLANDLGATVTSRSEFGTAKLRLGESSVDVAMARTETYPHPGALPIVSQGDLQEDLARRDFTVNAIAASLDEERWGDLADPFDGRGDLSRGVIRVLHPESFRDDATRILRAVRYAGRLGFGIEDETLDMLRRDLDYISTISGDRVRHELERIFAEERVADVLRLAHELGVLPAVYPSLRVDEAVSAGLDALGDARHADADLLPVALLALAVPAGELSSLASRLNMGAPWRRVVREVAEVRQLSEELDSADLPRSRVYQMLAPYSVTAVEACYLASKRAEARRRLNEYLEQLRHVRTSLNGDDVIGLGVPEGPQVGDLLDALLTARLDGLADSREDEERMIAEWLESRRG